MSKEYIVLSEENEEDLVQEVNKSLRQGWAIQGGVFVTCNRWTTSGGSGYGSHSMDMFYQAMTLSFWGRLIRWARKI